MKRDPAVSETLLSNSAFDSGLCTGGVFQKFIKWKFDLEEYEMKQTAEIDLTN